MFFLKENSANSGERIFMKMPKANDEFLFFPEAEVAKWFYECGIAEKNLITNTRDQYIDSSKNFIDIGAHVGTYSFIIGKKANHTFAFECNPKVFCYLAANIAFHELEEKVTPFRYALGNKETDMDYFIRSPDGGGNGVKVLNENDNNLKKIKVKVKTLDSFNLTNIGFIKIDVEGFEKEVIEGGLETLKNSNYPPILFESWGSWKESEGVPANKIKSDLFEYLQSIGYNVEIAGHHNDMYIAKHSLR